MTLAKLVIFFILDELTNQINECEELSWSVLDRQVLDEKYCNPTQGSCIDPIYEATQTVTHPSTNATNVA